MSQDEGKVSDVKGPEGKGPDGKGHHYRPPGGISQGEVPMGGMANAGKPWIGPPPTLHKWGDPNLRAQALADRPPEASVGPAGSAPEVAETQPVIAPGEDRQGKPRYRPPGGGTSTAGTGTQAMGTPVAAPLPVSQGKVGVHGGGVGGSGVHGGGSGKAAGKPTSQGQAEVVGSGGAKGYRGGLFDQLDVPAMTSLLICGVLFFLTVVGVKSVDYSSLDKKTLDDIPERIARIIMPMKPPGKAVPKPEEGPRKSGKAAAKDPGAAASEAAEDASAAARIERSRRTVTQQVAETQQRIQKSAVLAILSGKGPATAGVTTSRARARGRSLVDFGGLDASLADLEGLTKFDSKLDANPGGGKGAKSRDDGVGAMTGIDKMVKGFQNARMGAASKIGVMELEKPELLERNSRYTGDRSMADVGTFISKKQNMVTMLYEERLKVDPTLEGKITVVLVIEEDGAVSSATVLKSETTLHDPDFQAELLRRIKRWVFPPSTGGPVEMKSPFVFKPA